MGAVPSTFLWKRTAIHGTDRGPTVNKRVDRSRNGLNSVCWPLLPFVHRSTVYFMKKEWSKSRKLAVNERKWTAMERDLIPFLDRSLAGHWPCILTVKERNFRECLRSVPSTVRQPFRSGPLRSFKPLGKNRPWLHGDIRFLYLSLTHAL